MADILIRWRAWRVKRLRQRLEIREEWLSAEWERRYQEAMRELEETKEQLQSAENRLVLMDRDRQFLLEIIERERSRVACETQNFVTRTETAKVIEEITR